MTTSYLVLFDADKIKEYVFATGRLKEIRGASDQVRHLTDPQPIKDQYRQWFNRELADWHPDLAADEDGLIYAGGGAGALLFATEQRARDFCTKLEQKFRWETRSATLSAIYVPVHYESGMERNQAEAAAQDRAARALARRKANRPQAEAIPSGGVIRFCASDRLYPASSRVPEPDKPTGLLVSDSTALKRSMSRQYRRQFETGEVWQAFESALIAYGKHEHVVDWRAAISENQDLGHIGSQSRPRGYVALVYADGDSIGSTLRHVVKTYGFRGYAEFSAALTYAATHATAKALAAVYASRIPHRQRDRQERTQRRYLPFEVITVGGDDVLLICTAERGLDVACRLSQMFGTLVTEHLKVQAHQWQHEPITLEPSISASVGVLIGHDSLPITHLERRGRDLLKNAKQCAGNGTGGIDFHIVTTPVLDSITQLRQRDYQPDDKTLLTKRPYRCDDATRLLDCARYLRGFGAADIRLPNSKRADLYRACQSSWVQTALDVLAVHTRLTMRERRALLWSLAELGCVHPYPFAPRDKDQVYRTALLDLLELMEFVAREDVWEA